MAYLSMGESHRRITDYLNRFADAINYQDGDSLARLFSISSDTPSLLSLADALNVFQDANRLIKQSEKFSQYGEVVAPFFRSLQSYRLGNLVDAYGAFEKASNAFIQEFRNWESGWALEALYVIAYEIRVLAERADRELASNGKSPEKLKGAGSFLMKVFGVLAGKGPKRVGALYVTCQLFKIYFKLGTVHLCRSVIRSIETARIFDFEEFPTRDKVTYMYYTGRLEVLNENFPAADQKLSYALTHCSLNKEANIRFGLLHLLLCYESNDILALQASTVCWLSVLYLVIVVPLIIFLISFCVRVRMILKYLIPVKLSIGILPKKQLIENYNLVEVQLLSRSITWFTSPFLDT
ncbi:unnamed protein product [Linum tenue]|uniref:PCI domain-containing protein n=1 Tax=Linum tenue TaxID=586396 RepID=A0AAV0S951_9ROSI|nr:unnamed protein product [Linum tenue]